MSSRFGATRAARLRAGSTGDSFSANEASGDIVVAFLSERIDDLNASEVDAVHLRRLGAFGVCQSKSTVDISRRVTSNRPIADIDRLCA